MSSIIAFTTNVGMHVQLPESKIHLLLALRKACQAGAQDQLCIDPQHPSVLK